jgi:hypothetical protein
MIKKKEIERKECKNIYLERTQKKEKKKRRK